MKQSRAVSRPAGPGWNHRRVLSRLNPGLPDGPLQPDDGPGADDPVPGFHDAALAAASFPDFIKQAWPILEPSGVPLDWGWHLDCICDHLLAVSRGEIRSLILNVPPGCTKTLVVSVCWPAWEWIHRPWLRWLCAANDRELVTRDSLACRRLIQSDEYQAAWGHVYRMTSDQNVKTLYENDHRGHRTSVTSGTRVTGKKADIQVVDDPDDADKVHSMADRQSVHNWWDRSFYNRVNHFLTARRVLIGQRTHKDDLFGHIIPTGQFTVVAIPEQFESKTRFTSPLINPRTGKPWTDPRTKDGEWLRESRFGPAQAIIAKQQLGSVGYAHQHQQRGTAAEGKHFKEEWFDHYSPNDPGDGFVFAGDGRMGLIRDTVTFLIIDPATGKGPTGDLTAVGAFRLDLLSDRLMVLEMVSKLIPISDGSDEDLLSIVKRMVNRYGAEFVGVESDGFQRSVAEKIRDELHVVVREISHQNKGKLTRAQVAIIKAENGDIYVPPDADWVVDFLAELTSFTGLGTNEIDNQVDVLSYACAEAERMSAGEAEPMILGKGRRG